MLTGGQTCLGAGSVLGGIGHDVVTQSGDLGLSDLVIATGAVLTGGQTCLGAGSIDGGIGHDVVTQSGHLVSDVGVTASAGVGGEACLGAGGSGHSGLVAVLMAVVDLAADELNGCEQSEGAGQSIDSQPDGAVVVHVGQVDLKGGHSPALELVGAACDDGLLGGRHDTVHNGVQQHDAVVGVLVVTADGHVGVVATPHNDDLGVLGQIDLAQSDGALVQESGGLNTTGGDHAVGGIVQLGVVAGHDPLILGNGVVLVVGGLDGHDHGDLVEADHVALGILVQDADGVLALQVSHVDGDLHAGAGDTAERGSGVDDGLLGGVSPGLVEDGCVHAHLIAELTDGLGGDGDPAPIGQGGVLGGGHVSHEVPIGLVGDVVEVQVVLDGIVLMAVTQIELVEGLVRDHSLVLAPHGSLVQLEVIGQSVLSGVEERDVVDLQEALVGAAGVEVVTDVADGAVGHVGSNGGQVEDQEVPLAVVLVVEDKGLTALGACAVADEELTGLGGVGAVAHDHVLGHLTDVTAEEEPGVAAGSGEAGEAVLGLLNGRGSGVLHSGQILRVHDPDGISGIHGRLGLGSGSLGLVGLGSGSLRLGLGSGGLGVGLGSRSLGIRLGSGGGRLVGGSLSRGLGGGDVVSGGVRLIGSRLTSYGGDHQSEHEKCDQKQFLHVVLLKMIFFICGRADKGHYNTSRQESQGKWGIMSVY